MLPPTVAPLVVDTTPDGPLWLIAAPPHESGNNQGPPTLATTTIPPIPDELEDAVRKRSAEEQAGKEQIKIARSKKRATGTSSASRPRSPERSRRSRPRRRAGDRLQVTVPARGVLEYLGVKEPKPPCVTSDESENSVAKELAGFTLPLLLGKAASLLVVVGRHGGRRRVAADGGAGLGPAARPATTRPSCVFAIVPTAPFEHWRRATRRRPSGVGRGLRRRVSCRWVVDGGGLLAPWPCWFRSDGAPVDARVFRGRRLYPYPIPSLRAGLAHHGVAIDLIGARAASFSTRFDSWRECYCIFFEREKYP